MVNLHHSPVKGPCVAFTTLVLATLASITEAVHLGDRFGQGLSSTPCAAYRAVVNPFFYISRNVAPVEKSSQLVIHGVTACMVVVLVVLLKHSLHLFSAA